MKRLALIMLCLMAFGGSARAANCPSLPNTLANGTTADASQVMANFNSLLGCANAVTGLIGVKVFTSSGTYSCDAGTNQVMVEVIGGGAGGNGAAASGAGTGSFGVGGASGGYYKALITSASSVCPSGATVTVGGAGAGGVGTGATGSGGTSKFALSSGFTITCSGGTGGGAIPAAAPSGAAGNSIPGSCSTTGSSTGIVQIANIAGQGGGWSFWNSSLGLSGMGASSPLGIGGNQLGESSAFQQFGTPATGYGAGGGGAFSFLKSTGGAAQNGGNGSPGIVIVYELM